MIESSATGSAMTSSEAVVLQKVRIAAVELVNTCRFTNLDRVQIQILLPNQLNRTHIISNPGLQAWTTLKLVVDFSI